MTTPKKRSTPANDTYMRTEVKYRIPHDVYDTFIQRMDEFFELDHYGLSTICNIYYDTDNSDLISRSLAKPKYKEKIRLRSYGVPNGDSIVFAELKKKYAGTVYKRRDSLHCANAEQFLRDGISPEKDSQILREIAYARDFYHIKPAMFLAYDRCAYFGRKDPSMRMTIDRNIRYRLDRLSLEEGDDGELLPMNGDYLLEMKIIGGLPLEIVHIMNELKIYPSSFSKYGAIYKHLNHRPALQAVPVASSVKLPSDHTATDENVPSTPLAAGAEAMTVSAIVEMQKATIDTHKHFHLKQTSVHSS